MDDLHIGVTTSRGAVISYNWNGISKDMTNWQGCLVVYRLNDRCGWESQWDAVLADVAKHEYWDSARLVMIFATCWN